MLGGGFTSRCIFVYAEQKARLVPYLASVVPAGHQERRRKLIEDLIAISQGPLGEYHLTQGALDYGMAWYEAHYSNRAMNLEDDRFGGYIARKQTHIHKLAMVLAAAESDRMEITEHHLDVANTMVTDLEPDMARVFAKIGKSEFSFYADRLIQYIHRTGTVTYQDAYRYVHTHFPSVRDFEDVLAGLVRAGFVQMGRKNGETTIIAII